MRGCFLVRCLLPPPLVPRYGNLADKGPLLEAESLLFPMGSVGINAAGPLADADASRGPGKNRPSGGGTFEGLFMSTTDELPDADDGRCREKTSRFESSGSFANNSFDRLGSNAGRRIKRGSCSCSCERICNCGLG